MTGPAVKAWSDTLLRRKSVEHERSLAAGKDWDDKAIDAGVRLNRRSPSGRLPTSPFWANVNTCKAQAVHRRALKVRMRHA